jgi:hypothetical protein
MARSRGLGDVQPQDPPARSGRDDKGKMTLPRERNGSCSATTFAGSTALPFVISTEASAVERSAVSAVLSWKCFSCTRPVLRHPLKPNIFSIVYGSTEVVP